MLNSLYTGQSEATYTSNLGLNWLTYSNQIRNNIHYWLFDNTLLPEEDEPGHDEYIDVIYNVLFDSMTLLENTLKTMDYKEFLNIIKDSII